jgi:hypothetical protein
LYGAVAAIGSSSLCASLVLGFLSCLLLLSASVWLDYCGLNLSKKGCWVFPHLGFSQDKSCVLLFIVYAAVIVQCMI